MDPPLEKAEDLFTDATALVQRAKLELPPGNDPAVFGFRDNGALSIFFNPEVAYHFNQQHQLRRVFLHGERYKAKQGQLVCVRRIPGMRNVRKIENATRYHVLATSKGNGQRSNRCLDQRSNR